MKVAIFGGCGFIGRELMNDLLARGHEVLTIGRSGQPGVAPGHSHSTTAPGDRAGMLALLEDVDTLFHLACDSTPGSTRLAPVAEGTANILPSLELLEILQGLPALRLVFVSSGGAIYRPGADTPPSREDSALSPRSYYGAGKLALELFIEAYQHQTGHAAVILRPSNIYGPGQRARRQFAIVPTLLTALRDGTPFTIWGDGSARRDFLYIDDFLDLCHRVITDDQDREPGTIFNAGSGRDVSILELCDLVERVSGRTLHRTFAPRRGVDMPIARLATEKAQVTLGWSARTPLRLGLEQTWRWFLKNSA
ncbi:MAG: NAD-dependent epimerase/dehydratase family protein [Pseudohaliea sp.]